MTTRKARANQKGKGKPERQGQTRKARANQKGKGKPEKQRQRNNQIPDGDDNKRSKDRYKGPVYYAGASYFAEVVERPKALDQDPGRVRCALA